MQIHRTAIIGSDVKIGEEVIIGAHAIVGEDALGKSTEFRNQHSECDKFDKCSVLGRGVRIGEGAYIGIGSHLDDNVICDPKVYIGHYTNVGRGTHIMYNAHIHNGVKIGNEVWVSGFVCNRAVLEDDVVSYGSLVHRFVNADRVMDSEESPVVEKGAVIAFNSVIVGGVHIGEKAYIGAGSVLLTDAAPNRLYLGIPAQDCGPAPSPFKS